MGNWRCNIFPSYTHQPRTRLPGTVVEIWGRLRLTRLQILTRSAAKKWVEMWMVGGIHCFLVSESRNVGTKFETSF